ncbi:hypothetical protein ACSBM8_16285 [Sphingomonas sp. ASY06-1R]|uniref:hypothetical protein n=1 Tax=Sphingomonas sp. ASY06-1R TaxID=3445771 RepID=UPI003FA20984
MSPLRFRAGYAKYSDLAMLLAYAGESDPFDPPTMVIVLDSAQAPCEWGLENLDDVFVDVCAFQTGAMGRPAFVCVSEEGKVWFQREPRIVEDIAHAGLTKPTSLKLGAIGGIRPLGNALYAFGYAGQIYRRTEPGMWDHFDEGILGAPGDQHDVTGICLFDETFYAVTRMGGPGRIYTRRGETWVPAVNPSGEWLNAVEADQEGIVWICGRNGTLMKGNAAHGFALLSGARCAEEFLSIALYRGQVWLSSATSLYTWTGDRLVKVATGLSPSVRNAHRLQVVNGVLWSFGYDDILRYEGETWTRFACPGTAAYNG